LALTAAVAADDQQTGPAGQERMQQWTADHEALLDAGLGGMKAGLKLTADQEKLWGPFETAVRDAAKARMENMRKMIESAQARRDEMRQRMKERMNEAGKGDMESHDDGEMMENAEEFGLMGGERVSPVDRLENWADRMAERAAGIKKIADAAKPLYASLDDSQKRNFALLGREMLMPRRGPHPMGMMEMWRHHRDGGRGMGESE
jgi:hypothetical protein